MKIRMIEDAPGSPDGINVEQYEAGVEYDVPDDLADVFLAYGHAERVGDQGKKKSLANKKLSAAEENK